MYRIPIMYSLDKQGTEMKQIQEKKSQKITTKGL
jgi:hypothetical protein